jgi:hypothetical protein
MPRDYRVNCQTKIARAPCKPEEFQKAIQRFKGLSGNCVAADPSHVAWASLCSVQLTCSGMSACPRGPDRTRLSNAAVSRPWAAGEHRAEDQGGRERLAVRDGVPRPAPHAPRQGEGRNPSAAALETHAGAMTRIECRVSHTCIAYPLPITWLLLAMPTPRPLRASHPRVVRYDVPRTPDSALLPQPTAPLRKGRHTQPATKQGAHVSLPRRRATCRPGLASNTSATVASQHCPPAPLALTST